MSLLTSEDPKRVPPPVDEPLAERSGDDHFYGAWHGGKETQGGGPGRLGTAAARRADMAAKVGADHVGALPAKAPPHGGGQRTGAVTAGTAAAARKTAAMHGAIAGKRIPTSDPSKMASSHLRAEREAHLSWIRAHPGFEHGTERLRRRERASAIQREIAGRRAGSSAYPGGTRRGRVSHGAAEKFIAQNRRPPTTKQVTAQHAVTTKQAAAPRRAVAAWRPNRSVARFGSVGPQAPKVLPTTPKVASPGQKALWGKSSATARSDAATARSAWVRQRAAAAPTHTVVHPTSAPGKSAAAHHAATLDHIPTTHIASMSPSHLAAERRGHLEWLRAHTDRNVPGTQVTDRINRSNALQREIASRRAGSRAYPHGAAGAGVRPVSAPRSAPTGTAAPRAPSRTGTVGDVAFRRPARLGSSLSDHASVGDTVTVVHRGPDGVTQRTTGIYHGRGATTEPDRHGRRWETVRVGNETVTSAHLLGSRINARAGTGPAVAASHPVGVSAMPAPKAPRSGAPAGPGAPGVPRGLVQQDAASLYQRTGLTSAGRVADALSPTAQPADVARALSAMEVNHGAWVRAGGQKRYDTTHAALTAHLADANARISTRPTLGAKIATAQAGVRPGATAAEARAGLTSLRAIRSEVSPTTFAALETHLQANLARAKGQTPGVAAAVHAAGAAKPARDHAVGSVVNLGAFSGAPRTALRGRPHTVVSQGRTRTQLSYVGRGGVTRTRYVPHTQMLTAAPAGTTMASGRTPVPSSGSKKPGLKAHLAKVGAMRGSGNTYGVMSGSTWERSETRGLPLTNPAGAVQGVVRKDNPGGSFTMGYYHHDGRIAGRVEFLPHGGVGSFTRDAAGNRVMTPGVSSVQVHPDRRGEGVGKAMYDYIQDHTPLNMYTAIGAFNTFTAPGKKFAYGWLQHRALIPGELQEAMAAMARLAEATGGWKRGSKEERAVIKALLEHVKNADVVDSGTPGAFHDPEEPDQPPSDQQETGAMDTSKVKEAAADPMQVLREAHWREAFLPAAPVAAVGAAPVRGAAVPPTAPAAPPAPRAAPSLFDRFRSAVTRLQAGKGGEVFLNLVTPDGKPEARRAVYADPAHLAAMITTLAPDRPDNPVQPDPVRPGPLVPPGSPLMEHDAPAGLGDLTGMTLLGFTILPAQGQPIEEGVPAAEVAQPTPGPDPTVAPVAEAAMQTLREAQWSDMAEKKDGSDHFYGAWHGGSEKSGGGPGRLASKAARTADLASKVGAQHVGQPGVKPGVDWEARAKEQLARATAMDRNRSAAAKAAWNAPAPSSAHAALTGADVRMKPIKADSYTHVKGSVWTGGSNGTTAFHVVGKDGSTVGYITKRSHLVGHGGGNTSSHTVYDVFNADGKNIGSASTKENARFNLLSHRESAFAEKKGDEEGHFYGAWHGGARGSGGGPGRLASKSARIKDLASKIGPQNVGVPGVKPTFGKGGASGGGSAGLIARGGRPTAAGQRNIDALKAGRPGGGKFAPGNVHPAIEHPAGSAVTYDGQHYNVASHHGPGGSTVLRGRSGAPLHVGHETPLTAGHTTIGAAKPPSGGLRVQPDNPRSIAAEMRAASKTAKSPFGGQLVPGGAAGHWPPGRAPAPGASGSRVGRGPRPNEIGVPARSQPTTLHTGSERRAMEKQLAAHDKWLAGDWNSRSARGVAAADRHKAEADRLRAALAAKAPTSAPRREFTAARSSMVGGPTRASSTPAAEPMFGAYARRGGLPRPAAGTVREPVRLAPASAAGAQAAANRSGHSVIGPGGKEFHPQAVAPGGSAASRAFNRDSTRQAKGAIGEAPVRASDRADTLAARAAARRAEINKPYHPNVVPNIEPDQRSYAQRSADAHLPQHVQDRLAVGPKNPAEAAQQAALRQRHGAPSLPGGYAKPEAGFTTPATNALHARLGVTRGGLPPAGTTPATDALRGRLGAPPLSPTMKPGVSGVAPGSRTAGTAAHRASGFSYTAGTKLPTGAKSASVGQDVKLNLVGGGVRRGTLTDISDSHITIKSPLMGTPVQVSLGGVKSVSQTPLADRMAAAQGRISIGTTRNTPSGVATWNGSAWVHGNKNR